MLLMLPQNGINLPYKIAGSCLVGLMIMIIIGVGIDKGDSLMTLIAIITYGTLAAMAVGLVWLVASTARMIINDIRHDN